MREWLLSLSPVVVLAYFLAYPDQLSEFLALVNRLTH